LELCDLSNDTKNPNKNALKERFEFGDFEEICDLKLKEMISKIAEEELIDQLGKNQ
jgi:hypothetical protein